MVEYKTVDLVARVRFSPVALHVNKNETREENGCADTEKQELKGLCRPGSEGF